MANRAALLIGVSEYSEADLKPLPSATKDVQAMQRVLLRSGEFPAEQIRALTNPQKQEVEEAIYWLFADRQKEDLLLFYFSGHGIKDETGKLYFSLPATRKDRGRLMKHTAVPATVLHESMNGSRSTCQVLVLDCCFSGAFAKGLTIKDDGSVDISAQLGGKGRAIFTSSNSIEYSFQQDGLNLSVYTHFFVEGLEKGTADLDSDGLISADELHTYVSDKVKQAAPAMTPQFFPVEQGHKIYLARSAKDDPSLKYRKAVEQRVNSFQMVKNRFSIPVRRALDILSHQLGITVDMAEAIETEVLQSLREYQRKLQEYEQTLRETLEDEGDSLSEATKLELKDYQMLLGLQDKDVQEIEAKTSCITDQLPASASHHSSESNYSDGIVAILDAKQSAIGTGFLLRYQTQWLVVTCTHVLQKLNLETNSTVQLSHFNSEIGQFEAEIVRFEPPTNSPHEWTAFDDTSILRSVQSFSRYNLKPYPLHSEPLYPDIYPYGKQSICFGYAQDRANRGDYVPVLAFAYVVASGFVALTHDGGIRPGVSGAPWANADTQTIVGMVQATGATGNRAYLIPASVILRVIATFCSD